MRALMRQLPRMRVRMERVKGSAARDKRQGATELEQQYAVMVAELDSMGRELAPMIEQLQDANERAAMKLRYIERYKPDDVAYAMAYCQRHTMRILERAEKRIESM